MPSAGDVVDRLLHQLVRCMGARDVAGALRLFAPDAVLFGSEQAEYAIGIEHLRALFIRLFARPHTYAWTWEPPLVGSAGDVVWFVMPATVVTTGDDGETRSAPYRLSGVVDRRRGCFLMFNGAEPVV